MYAMPLSVNTDGSLRVFWEETSLVGKGRRRLSFNECKKRAFRRLDHHGIKVFSVEEEEYCYIPMGGELPDLTQRVIGFGGAANMVHPATGYHACRMLAASTDLSRSIGEGIRSKESVDKISADSYRVLWGRPNRGQRDFQAFGNYFSYYHHYYFIITYIKTLPCRGLNRRPMAWETDDIPMCQA